MWDLILLLGATGYIGQAFVKLMTQQGIAFRSLSRQQHHYTRRDILDSLLREIRPDFLINCAGYTGKPNVDACELHRTECLFGNAVLPGRIQAACQSIGIPWGHVSSGCIYTGSHPDGGGFTEQDAPNFCFRTNNCSFYSGCKALAEEMLSGAESCYIWRLRIPFNEIDSPRNYLSKVRNYARLLEATNSFSQLDEFVAACLDCWTRRVPFGIYNVTNTGSMTTRQITDMVRQHLDLDRQFDFFESEAEFMRLAAKTPRSNCVLDNSKLLSTGVMMSSVEDAMERALRNWKSA